MLLVIALLFPVALMVAVLLMGRVEHRLDRNVFTVDVDRYLEDMAAEGDEHESAIAIQAQRLITRARP